jgi:hypothetical protein
MNSEIHDDAIDPVQWDCPNIENGLMVGPPTMDNNMVSRFKQSVKKPVELSLTSQDLKQKLLFAVYCSISYYTVEKRNMLMWNFQNKSNNFSQCR